MPLKTTSPSAAIREKFPDTLERVQPAKKTKLVPRPTKDENGLNKMEAAWLQILRTRPADWLGIQPFGLKLADNCRYHPDFVTLTDGQLTAWETKGFMRDDAAVKIKVAARLYPWIRFVLVTKKGKPAEWIETEVSP